jgi:hypothetical protein
MAKRIEFRTDAEKSKAIHEVINTSGLRVCMDVDETDLVTLFGKFQLSETYFQEVQSRLMRVLPSLKHGVEYTFTELNIRDPNSTMEFSADAKALLCLKHFAGQPNPVIEEVSWGSFRRTTAKNVMVWMVTGAGGYQL